MREADDLIEAEGEDSGESELRTSREVLLECRSILSAVTYGVERADNKAGILVAALSLYVGVEVALMPGAVSWAAGNRARFLVPAMLGVSLAWVIVAILVATFSIYPRLGPPFVYRGQLQAGDLLYFGRLRAIPPEDIEAALVASTSDGSIVSHFTEQIHVNSSTAWWKHVQLRRALVAFTLGVVSAGLALLTWAILSLA